MCIYHNVHTHAYISREMFEITEEEPHVAQAPRAREPSVPPPLSALMREASMPRTSSWEGHSSRPQAKAWEPTAASNTSGVSRSVQPMDRHDTGGGPEQSHAAHQQYQRQVTPAPNPQTSTGNMPSQAAHHQHHQQYSTPVQNQQASSSSMPNNNNNNNNNNMYSSQQPFASGGEQGHAVREEQQYTPQANHTPQMHQPTILRPRPMHNLNPLDVARYVTRMGSMNR